MLGEVHKNEVTRNDVQNINKNFEELSKEVDLLRTKIKSVVSSIKIL